eukprot:767949-Hanusia_phi.AAC.1
MELELELVVRDKEIVPLPSFFLHNEYLSLARLNSRWESQGWPNRLTQSHPAGAIAPQAFPECWDWKVRKGAEEEEEEEEAEEE